MNIESVREFCLSLDSVEETTPFDSVTLVYKVTLKSGKTRMFALIGIDNPDYLAVKCDPDLAVEIRDRYDDSVEGAWHFNKTHWNGVKMSSGSLSDSQIKAMIVHSYQLVSEPKSRHQQSAQRLRDLTTD